MYIHADKYDYKKPSHAKKKKNTAKHSLIIIALKKYRLRKDK